MEGVGGEDIIKELNPSGLKADSSVNKSPRSPLSPKSPQSEALDLQIAETPMEHYLDTSIERLYDNVCQMQSSDDQSQSRQSFGSDGEESRIDSELRHLVGGEIIVVEKMKEEEEIGNDGASGAKDLGLNRENGSVSSKSGKLDMTRSVSNRSVSSTQSKRPSRLKLSTKTLPKSSPKSKVLHEETSIEQVNDNGSSPASQNKVLSGSDKIIKTKGIGVVSVKKNRRSSLGLAKIRDETEEPSEAGLDNPDLGPFLLKLARDLVASGDNPQKALELALRAAKSIEKCADGKPSLDLVFSLHFVAAIHCSLGQYTEAIPVLEQSIGIPVLEEGQDHVLAAFAGYMQLGDTYAMLGLLENSIQCYTTGLEVQKQVLGEMDPRVGETCRYLAEAYVQALQFDEAEKLCQHALDIHKERGASASLEEAADRRLMGLICDTKGDHEAALEHLVLASMALISNGQEAEVASVDCSIGDTYLSLARYDEAVFSYQKALTVFKSTKGENHPTVASVFVRLADIYHRTGKLRESKSYCENALRIYEKPAPGSPIEEIASGFTDVSAIYEAMNEIDKALKLLHKALKIYNDAPGQQSTVAGIEAQMGVMYYMIGNNADSYASFKNAVEKLRTTGEKRSAFFGIALNQMGLACIQRYALNEAADLFEEARSILEQEYGPYHPDTLGVYSNLAGTYDAMGRLNDAIEILEYVVGIREEKLGTANPDVDDEKRRLEELLKEAGRARNRKAKSLETLLVSNSRLASKDAIKV